MAEIQTPPNHSRVPPHASGIFHRNWLELLLTKEALEWIGQECSQKPPANTSRLHPLHKGYHRLCSSLDEMHVRESLYLIHTLVFWLASLTLVTLIPTCWQLNTPSTRVSQPVLAMTMITFMVRGLCTKLYFPYAQFPCAKCHRWSFSSMTHFGKLFADLNVAASR